MSDAAVVAEKWREALNMAKKAIEQRNTAAEHCNLWAANYARLEAERDALLTSVERMDARRNEDTREKRRLVHENDALRAALEQIVESDCCSCFSAARASEALHGESDK